MRFGAQSVTQRTRSRWPWVVLAPRVDGRSSHHHSTVWTHCAELYLSSVSYQGNEITVRRFLQSFIRAMRILALSIGSLFVVGILLWFILDGPRRPIRWEIPSGYHGWIAVIYENPSCAALPSDGLYERVITIDSDGCGCTSDAPLNGWRHNRYEFVQAGGERVEIPDSAREGGREIWAGFSVPRQREHPLPVSGFFVGTQADLTNWGWTVSPGGSLSQQKIQACEQAATSIGTP